MDNQNLNSSYLNSDAVANYMQAADLSIGDANGRLSSNELSQFMNQNIVTWVNPPSLTTGDQINTDVLGLHGSNAADNLAHFQVYYVLGVYLLNTSKRQDLTVNVTYDQLVTQFNQTYGNEQQGQADPCVRPNPEVTPPVYPNQPETYADCLNCDDEDIISREPLQDIPLEELYVLPSRNCMRGEDIQRIINEPHPDRRVDPWSRQTLTGGKKRRSRKAKKSRKTRKTKIAKK